MHSREEKNGFVSLILFLVICLAVTPSWGQAPPPNRSRGQIDTLVTRVALYPDPLLAQILAAATFPEQISEAAKYADEHHYLSGEALAKAISDDHVPWDPSVQALLPFPSVLDMMVTDMGWTTDLGNAFLAQRQDVMDAIQRMRQKAKDYGYLQTNSRVRIDMSGPYIEILPADPTFICAPYYNPAVVFTPPRPGFILGGAINFGFGVTIGAAFRPWGWGVTRFDWGAHALLLNDRPWGRTWINRTAYVHPYVGLPRWQPRARVESHALTPRSEREREGARMGRPRVEDHARH